MKKLSGIILGVLLMAAGIIFALDALNIAHINISLDGWWTLFIIVPSLCGLVTSRDKTGNLIVLLIGIYLLLSARNIIEYKVFGKLFVPVIIVLIGLKVLVKSLKGADSEPMPINDENAECMAAFEVKNADCTGESIRAAKVGAVFGSTKCNLSGTEFNGKSHIDVFCLFGGAEIIVPENVDVKINAFCLFGGISDKRAVKDNVEKTAELTVNGCCLFGGADIK